MRGGLRKKLCSRAVAAAAKTFAIAAASTTLTESESLGDLISVLKCLANQFATFGDRLGAVDITNSRMTSLERLLANIETKLEAAVMDFKKLEKEKSTKSKSSSTATGHHMRHTEDEKLTC